MTVERETHTYRYESNVFVGGKKIVSEVKELTGFDLFMHTGKSSREAFLELINRWNGNGQIGYGTTHDRLYLYRALS